MKSSSTVFLQVIIGIVGLAALAFMLVEPHFEGRNRDATVFEVYFHDPFLAYVYLASIPFFVAIFQAIRVLNHVRQNTTFSPTAVQAVRTIKYCTLLMIGFVAFSFVFMMFGEQEDRPQGIMMRVFVAVPSIVVATAAAIFERLLQNAVELKSENDLTV